jgi:hypothetical protein
MGISPRLIAIFPAGIGLTVLFALWGGAFGFAPFIFKVFGSFVACFFIMGGVGIYKTAEKLGDPRRMAQTLQEMQKELTGNQPERGSSSGETAESSSSKVGYDCPNCGASLGKEADVSPSGDVKCGYCERWFNIHSEG